MIRHWWLAVLLLIATTSVSAQAPPIAQPPEVEAGAEARADTAVLVVANRPVVTFRAPLGARSPAERVASAAARIDAVVDAGETGPISARRLPYGYVIAVGPHGVFTVTPDDGDPGLLPMERRVARVQESLAAALKEHAEQRSLRHLLLASLLAIGATLLFVAVIRLIRQLRGFLLRRLREPASDRIIRDIAAHGFTILSAAHLRLFARRVVDLIAWGTGLFLAYVWVAFVLTSFAYTRPWGEALGSYLSETLRGLAVGAISGIPGLFTAVIILVFARWVTRLIGAFFDAVATERVQIPWAHPDTAQATKRIVKLGVWILAVVVAYPYIPGSGTDVFKGVSVFVGVVISLGSTGIVNQAMSGLVLMYSRALKPGDYVRVGETEGTVTKLAMLSTKIVTTKHEEMTIPNAVMVANGIRNFTRLSEGDGLIVHTAVTIGYDVPWRQVEALLLLAADRTPELAKNPPPFVLKRELADFYVDYELNAHLTAPERRIPALSALHAQILDAFNEYGVQILSPHYRSDPPEPAVVPRERWFTAPARQPESVASAGRTGPSTISPPESSL
ncbi:MAG TPA: mechanosensitive ion channel domain-containing protein [Gemmatimonadaceae bacterium]|nr:mechanosensitive ion channel domain-containing protein [Gemmatimonadaceae bacterium]